MIVFVGDKPSKRTDPNIAFRGAACEERLMNWINKIRKHLLINEFHTVINKDKIDHIIQLYGEYHFLIWVALGNNASKELKDKDIQHFKLPHPSGRNRQINNKTFIRNKLNDCIRYIEGGSC